MHPDELMSALSSKRPVLVALLIIAICFLLLRPRRKQRPQQVDGSTSAAGAATQKAAPSLSLSTQHTLLEFRNGSPQLKRDALDALFRLCARHSVFLITQLPTDSDDLEAAVMTMLEGAGVFEQGRRGARDVGCERRVLRAKRSPPNALP